MKSVRISNLIKQKYSDEVIANIISQVRKSIEIKDRRHHFEKHNMWFVGRDLVDWFIENGKLHSFLP